MDIEDSATFDENEAIRQIKMDCECHYQFQNKIMFSSRADFYTWLEEEVRFHARMKGLDFQKAKEAYIAWAKENHPTDYDQVK